MAMFRRFILVAIMQQVYNISVLTKKSVSLQLEI